MSKTQPKRAFFFLCAPCQPAAAPQQVFLDVRQDHAQSPTTVRQTEENRKCLMGAS
jgi:hypothetical protein